MLKHSDITKATDKFDQIVSHRKSQNSIKPIAYHSLSVIHKLSKAKFPVYLVTSKVDKNHYVIKVFSPNVEGHEEYFKNEIRFLRLQHPNIINMLYHEKERTTIHKGEMKKMSYILMEYAPHGDFFDFVTKYKDLNDEKLARTYFKQLIEGIEYLHGSGIAHLDIKPENLLLGVDFNLKITDFDLSYVYGDKKVISKGTKYYRAPEFFRPGSGVIRPKGSFAADIYSAGIILFILKSGGIYPHAEDDLLEGVNFSDLMYRDNKKFWTRQSEIQEKKSSFYDQNFRELFNNMVKLNPNERFTIKQIRQSKWYNGPTYTPSQLHDKMKRLLNC